jgi:hypothetical protein
MSTALTSLPKHHLARLARAGVAFKKRAEASRETGEKIAGMALATGESAAVAFTLGALNARGVSTVPGLNVPLSLAAAGAALAGSFFVGKHSDHLVNAAQGAIAVYGYQMGAMWSGGASAAKLFGAPKAVGAPKAAGVAPFPAAIPKAA